MASTKKNFPLVSIVTVVFNGVKTIQRTINSVQSQTYRNIEYIVIDGCSTDGTIDILKNNINLINQLVSEKDNGIYDAMNKGIEIASGDYILLLNSDDWYEPDAVEQLVQEKFSSGADIVGGLARYISSNDESKILPSMSFDAATLLRMPLRHQTMLVPKSIYEKVGTYSLDYSIISDFEFTIRLYLEGYSYSEVDAPLLNFVTTGVSNTNWAKLHAEHIKLLTQVFPDLSKDEAAKIGNHAKARPQDFLDVCKKHRGNKLLRESSQLLLNEFSDLWEGYWKDEYINISDFITENNPLVSIVIPMFNCEKTILSTLESCTSQSYEYIEIICVDDCSTDATVSIVDTLSCSDSRICVSCNQNNSGPGQSRNNGFLKSQGDLIMFVDSDDQLCEDSVESLLDAYRQTHADIVRGAFRVSRKIFGNQQNEVKPILRNQTNRVVSLTGNDKFLALETSEGHWACLYKRELILLNPYPKDLSVGEDSLFLINAVKLAKEISIISDVVYIYRDSENSVMNNLTLKKVLDELSWRKQAWSALRTEYSKKADYFALDYWDVSLINSIKKSLAPAEQEIFKAKLEEYCSDFSNLEETNLHRLRQKMLDLGAPVEPDALSNVSTHYEKASEFERQKILLLYSLPNGGAAVAAQRMLKQFSKAGHIVSAICLKGDGSSNIYGAYFDLSSYPELDDLDNLWSSWHQSVSVSSSAREFFSKEAGLVDLSRLKKVIDSHDVIYLHFHVGLIAIDDFPKLFRDKKVIWTFHDMSPMTGGCHYSESCIGYQADCRNCSFLATDIQSLATYTLESKSKSISQLKKLKTICPSRWLADHAKSSSVFKNIPNAVIPNFVDDVNFKLQNQVVCRASLGLDFDKKIILFGADSLSNRRKGGDYFVAAIEIMHSSGLLDNVQIVTFGLSDLKLPIPSHALGKISDPSVLGQVFAAADVFAFPSLEENAPQVVIESLLAGTPVVAFPVGNIPDILSKGSQGYIARYADSADFAKGISCVLDRVDSDDYWEFRLNIHRSIKTYANNTEILEKQLDWLYS